MQNLSPRHVKTEESLRLGVVSGWYSTKVSGTFVTGPHVTEADCRGKIRSSTRRRQSANSERHSGMRLPARRPASKNSDRGYGFRARAPRAPE